MPGTTVGLSIRAGCHHEDQLTSCFIIRDNDARGEDLACPRSPSWPLSESALVTISHSLCHLTFSRKGPA